MIGAYRPTETPKVRKLSEDTSTRKPPTREIATESPRVRKHSEDSPTRKPATKEMYVFVSTLLPI
jgi:hypothetical protein